MPTRTPECQSLSQVIDYLKENKPFSSTIVTDLEKILHWVDYVQSRTEDNNVW